MPGARARLAILVALLLALPAGGSAQEPPPEDPWGPPLELPARSRPALWETAIAAAAITAANWADIATTQQLVAAGGREAWNPGLYGPGAERIVPVKVAVTAAETGVFYALRKWRKEAAWAWVGVIVVGNVLIAQRNDRITDRLRAQQLGAGGPQLTAGHGLPLSGFQVSISW